MEAEAAASLTSFRLQLSRSERTLSSSSARIKRGKELNRPTVTLKGRAADSAFLDVPTRMQSDQKG